MQDSKPWNDASWLWIDSTPRAVAFLLAAAAIFIAAFAAESFGSRFVLAHISPTGEPDGYIDMPSRVARAIQSRSDLVLLVGGSTARELPPSDAFMSSQLSSRCGRDIRFVGAGSSDQVTAETWALTDSLPQDRLKLVVVAMNEARFEEGFDDVRRSFAIRRLPFASSSALASVLAQMGYAPAATFLPMPWTSWLENKRLKLAWKAAPRQDATGEDQFQTPANGYKPPILSDRDKQLVVAEMMSKRLRLYRQGHGEAVALWTEFAGRLQRRGTKVLFLELKGSAFLAPLKALTADLMAADLAALRQSGASVEHIGGEEKLVESDFYDQQHLVRSGREKIATGLVDQLARLLPGCAAR